MRFHGWTVIPGALKYTFSSSKQTHSSHEAPTWASILQLLEPPLSSLRDAATTSVSLGFSPLRMSSGFGRVVRTGLGGG